LNSEAVIAQYTPAGTNQWISSASNAPANPVGSIAAKCAVDSAGNCYLAGWYQGTANFGTNALQPQETWNFFLAQLAGQYSFGSQFQSTNTASITYNSGTGVFQYTDTNSDEDFAGIPLAGNAANMITSSNGWTASVSAGISARTMGGTANQAPFVYLGLIVYSVNFSQDRFFIEFGQVNNTAGDDSDDLPNGFYGTAVRGSALLNGNYDVVALLGGSQRPPADTDVFYQIISGTTGPANTPVSESIGAFAGVLTLNYSASTKTVTGYYNGSAVGSYSIAGWGTNPPLTLAVFGASEEGAVVPTGTDTASNFYAGSFPAIQTTNASFGVRTNMFGFTIAGPINMPVIVEAATNLANHVWQPLQTNTLTNGSFYFGDAQWTNYPRRFYRIRSTSP
jgi:hypothetical protein